MRNSSPVPETAARESREASAEGHGSAAPGPTGRGAGDSVNSDSPAEAQGRRTLSTAFVRVGADRHLTVELSDGRAMVLRDVAMGPREYCGVLVLGDPAGKRYCGGYGDIATARPGGGPAPGAPDPATLDPVEPGRSPSRRE